MKHWYLLITFLSLLSISLAAQISAPFSEIDEASMSLPQESEVNLPISSFRSLDLSIPAITALLQSAPEETSHNLRHSNNILDIPLPHGGTTAFRIVESSVMPDVLQARWPQLRSYRAINIDHPQYQGRFSFTPYGMHGSFQTENGNIYIEPYASAQQQYHVVYDEMAMRESMGNGVLQQASCGYVPSHKDDEDDHNSETHSFDGTKGLLGDDMVIREYTIALTCTGEYAQQKGGTMESVMATFVSAATLLNQIYTTEVGIRMVLIENQEALIFLNAFTDPFLYSDDAEELITQVQNAIVNVAGFPGTVFDIGHVFTLGCIEGIGGLASLGSACGGNKTRGVTCHYSNSLAFMVNGTMAHEVGHQFSMSHSWNNCPPSAENISSGSAWEPGSGSTIMSYDGACGAANNLANSGPYYHAGSLEQFINFTRVAGAADCATIIPTDNTEPDIIWPYEDGFYIPISTPFELDAQAEDAEGDPMTYVWDQMNIGPSSPLGSPTGNAPSFQFLAPISNTKRVFPRLPILVNNNSEVTEVLPTYSRDLTFRFAIRDNNPEVSSTVWRDVAFHATASAGPFRVMSPNDGSEVWKGGELHEVVWDVANTDNELVNCQLVNIKMSLDGGFTYPVTLMSETVNNGSAQVYVPDGLSSTQARVRVEAARNIFFDISNQNFSVQPAEVAAFTMNYGPIFQDLCLPGSAAINIGSAAILDYENPIDLELVGDIHPEIIHDFGSPSLIVGEGTTLNVDFSGVENYDGPMEITLRVVSEGTDTAYQNFYFELVDNDFEELALLEPVDGQAGIGLTADFSWTALPNAQFFDWELATDAAFTNIVDQANGQAEIDLTPNIFFEENTLYFWRVRPINECGTGGWSETKIFHTINAICAQEAPGDVPITIPGTGPLPTITSEIYVPFDGEISDINLPYVNVGYQPIQNFYISLTSPAGTEVRLYDQDCFTTDLVSIGFDDDAPSDVECPPDDAVVFRPAEPLSTFIGQNSLGIWTLKVKVLETGFGAPGSLNNWGVEFCAEGNAQAPTLITNDTLYVPPGQFNTITNTKLAVTDSEQTAEEIKFIITALPQNGTLYLAENEVTLGDYFRQLSVNANNVIYAHDGSDTQFDAFTFVVEDGTGGFLPSEQFDIKIDEDAAVGTDDVFEKDVFQLYPNPTSDWIRLVVPSTYQERMPIKIFNTQGQLLHQAKLQSGSLEWYFDMNNFPDGVYIIQLGQTAKRLVKF